MSVSERQGSPRAALSHALDALVERDRDLALTVDQCAALGLRLLRTLDGAQEQFVQR